MNPAQITFRGMDVSEALSEHIRDQYEKLFRFNERITSCHVVVEQPHRHKQKGRAFEVRLTLTLPGHEVAVTRGHEEVQENPYALVDELFKAARRMLTGLAGKRQARRTEPSLEVLEPAQEVAVGNLG